MMSRVIITLLLMIALPSFSISYFAEGDRDNDLILDDVDNCPDVANPGQEDSNEDGVGDACDTGSGDGDIGSGDDGEGEGDGDIVCYNDRDGDGWLDEEDNCPDHANDDQLDTDNNGVGDACDQGNGSDPVVPTPIEPDLS